MRRPIAALLTAGALLVTSGCGSGTSPADDVPALATSLDAVDEAVVSGDEKAVRDAVAELTDTTTRAQEAGDLDADAATRILEAAGALLAALGEADAPPAEETPEPPTPTPPAPAPTDEGGDEDGDEEDDDDEDGPDPRQGKPDKDEGKPKKPKGKGKP